MKKLLLVLLVVVLAAFLLVGCNPVTPPVEGEGEGEGEEITVEIEGLVEIEGKYYITDYGNPIVITFPDTIDAPVYVSGCYTECNEDNIECFNGLWFFPNEDKTVWTSFAGWFGYDVSDFCECYIVIESGECDEGGFCVEIPVIVYPESGVGVTFEEESAIEGINIDGLIVVDNKSYIPAGNHGITVTFQEPALDSEVYAFITECNGDYNQAPDDSELIYFYTYNTNNTVWESTSYGYFGNDENVYCTRYIGIESDVCGPEGICLVMPVFVCPELKLTF